MFMIKSKGAITLQFILNWIFKKPVSLETCRFLDFTGFLFRKY